MSKAKTLPKDTHIMVGVPMYGGMCTSKFTKSAIELSALSIRYGIPVTFMYLTNESLIQRARNYIADGFMRSDCTHLMFIDADIGFDPHAVFSLLIEQVNNDDYDVIGAPYPKKTIRWDAIAEVMSRVDAIEFPDNLQYVGADFVFNTLDTTFDVNRVTEVQELGTGFMLIPRATLEKYKSAYPELAYYPDHLDTADFNGDRQVHAYFDCEIDPVTKRYLSEDYFFCRNVRNMHGRIWMCPWIELDHVGTYTYKGSIAKYAQVVETQ